MPTQLSLETFHITRPEKIRWTFPEVHSEEAALAAIKSKSLRSFLRNIDTLLTQREITVDYHQLNEQQFAEWLPYYQQKMTENQYEIIASMEWFAKKMQEQRTVEGVFFRQHGELVGTGIFTQKADEAVFAFKASERIELSGKENSSLGAAIDYFFIREKVRQGVKKISAGRSRNAFGVVNSLGYLDYKLKFGYLPTADTETPPVATVPLDEEGKVVFYGQHDDSAAFYVAHPQGMLPTLEVMRFATPELPFTPLEYSPAQMVK